MNNLTQLIDNAIKHAVNCYIDRIVKEYEGIDKNELHQMWTAVAGSSCAGYSSPARSVKSVRSSASTFSGEGCPYRFQRGAKTGEACGAKPKKGITHCSRHEKYEGKEMKSKKILPAPKKSIKPKQKGSPAPKNVALSLRNHPVVDRFYHPESGLAFHSAEKRVVIGKVKNNKLLPLKDEDIQECKRWGFKYEDTSSSESAEPSTSEPDDLPEEDKKTVCVELEAPSATGGKFWNCSVEGSTMTTRYGKNGSNGRTTTKEFDSHDDAVKALEAEKKKKLKKEYTEKGAVVNEPDEDNETVPVSAPKPVASKKTVEDVLIEMDQSGDEDIDDLEKHVSKALGVDSDDDEFEME